MFWILVVKEEQTPRDLFCTWFVNKGCPAAEAADGTAASVVSAHTRPALIMTDMMMGRAGGAGHRGILS